MRAVVQNQRMKKPTPPKRGGARPGAGRPAIDPTDPTVTFSLRLTTSQRAKLESLGGAAWLRERIDKARPA